MAATVPAHAAAARQHVAVHGIHFCSPPNPTILRAKENREASVVQQALMRRVALGGLAALPLMRGASAQDPTKASIALLRLSSVGPDLHRPGEGLGSRKRASISL